MGDSWLCDGVGFRSVCDMYEYDAGSAIRRLLLFRSLPLLSLTVTVMDRCCCPDVIVADIVVTASAASAASATVVVKNRDCCLLPGR